MSVLIGPYKTGLRGHGLSFHFPTGTVGCAAVLC